MILYEIPKQVLEEELKRYRQVLVHGESVEVRASARGAIEVLTWLLERYSGYAAYSRIT
jgi:hypothetical protein